MNGHYSTSTAIKVLPVTVCAALTALVSGCGLRSDDTASLAVKETKVWVVPVEGSRQPAPRCVATGINGEIVVLDTAGRVLVYAADGKCVRRWHMPDVAVGKPEGVLVRKNGNVLVCDTHYHRVIEFDSNGTLLRQFGEQGREPGQFIYPVAIAMDAAGNLLVAEYGSNDRIQVFSPEGRFLRAFGHFGTKPGEFQRPSGLVWHAGQVYVADAFNNRIQVFTDQGEFVHILATPALDFPYDLKLGNDASLYVIEYGAGRLTRIGLDGALLGRYGSSGAGIGQFATPWGLAVSRPGNIVVADTGNRRIVELIPE